MNILELVKGLITNMFTKPKKITLQPKKVSPKIPLEIDFSKSKAWKGIVIHHSATKDGVTKDWDAMRKYHMSWRYHGDIITEELAKKLIAKGVTGVEEPWKDIGYHCLPEGSLVFSDSGVEKVENIRNHKLYGAEGTFNRVKNCFTRFYDGDIINIDLSYLPSFSLTPEHPVLVYRKKLARDYVIKTIKQKFDKFFDKIWVKPVDLTKQDYLVFPKYKPLPSSNVVDLSKYVPNRKHYKVLENKIVASSKVVIHRYVACNKCLVALLGWYVAEGCRSKETVLFTLNKKETVYAHEISELLFTLFGITPKIKEDKTSLQVICYSTVLGNFLETNCGKGALNKRIPELVLNGSIEILKSFLIKLLQGDGYITNNYFEFNTYSLKLVYDLYLGLSRLGILPCYSVNTKQRIMSGLPNKPFKRNPAYMLHVSGKQKEKLFPNTGQTKYNCFIEHDNFFLVPIKNIQKQHYTGKVYNFETEDHTYCAPVVVHNCGLELVGDGYVYCLGRPLSWDGGHTKGFNRTHIGICVVGNYDSQEPTQTQITLLVNLINFLKEYYKFKADDVIGHWESFIMLGVAKTKEEAWSKHKTCPGKMFPIELIRSKLT